MDTLIFNRILVDQIRQTQWLKVQGIPKKAPHLSCLIPIPPWSVSKQLIKVWPLPLHTFDETDLIFEPRVIFNLSPAVCVKYQAYLSQVIKLRTFLKTTQTSH